MDVKVFRWSRIPLLSRSKILYKDQSISNEKGNIQIIKEFFQNNYDSKVIPTYEKGMFITDYKIHMPRDRYVEFALTWL